MKNELLELANKLYDRIPVHVQFAIDEDEFSGLEPEELPNGYERLGINGVVV